MCIHGPRSTPHDSASVILYAAILFYVVWFFACFISDMLMTLAIVQYFCGSCGTEVDEEAEEAEFYRSRYGPGYSAKNSPGPNESTVLIAQNRGNRYLPTHAAPNH